MKAATTEILFHETSNPALMSKVHTICFKLHATKNKKIRTTGQARLSKGRFVNLSCTRTYFKVN